MFSVCVCACVFLCFCRGRGLATSWSPVQGVLPTVPDQETQETQPYAPKAGASSQVWEQRGRKEKFLWEKTIKILCQNNRCVIRVANRAPPEQKTVKNYKYINLLGDLLLNIYINTAQCTQHVLDNIHESHMLLDITCKNYWQSSMDACIKELC
jgi:hypothetical protein